MRLGLSGRVFLLETTHLSRPFWVVMDFAVTIKTQSKTVREIHQPLPDAPAHMMRFSGAGSAKKACFVPAQKFEPAFSVFPELSAPHL
jgi:hypothetical protein